MRLSDSAEVLVRRNNKVVYHDGGRLVKVFNSEKTSADVFNEALNTARVESTGLRVPEVLEVGRVEGGEHDGAWALAHRYIPGTNLFNAWRIGGEQDAEAFIDKLVELQIEVQGHTAPLLNRQKDKLQRMVSATKDVIDATTRYDLHMRIDGMAEAEFVCHGDFIASNVIVEEGTGNPYLCDWAHVTAGLPEVDAAMSYLLLNVEYPEIAELYVNTYCRQADVARQMINYWLPVVAAAELSRGRKRSEELLKSWVNIYDYE